MTREVGTAVLVIVLVGGGESGSDWAAGMLQALREALDRSVVVDVRERDEALAPPPDAYVLSIGFSANKLKAQLDTRQPSGREGKEVSFKKSDRPLDRGRAIGYALAALLPELRADAIGPDLSPASPTPALHAFLPVSDYVPHGPPAVEAPLPPAPIVLAAPPRVALEASALAGTSAGSDFAIGPAVTLQVTLGKGVAVRAGGFAVYGGSPLASSELRRIGGRLGFRVAALKAGPVAFSVGADAVALHLEVARPDESESRWVPAVSGALEVALCISRVAFFVAPQLHWAFGPTTVSVHEVWVGTVPQQLFTLEAGLRWWP
jgi:hypothetical protein